MTEHFGSLWCLDPTVAYLNHGSYGACPLHVLEFQQSLRLKMERQPMDFLSRRLPGRLQAAREALAAFVGAAPDDTVFVHNVTTAVNAVFRSLELEPGDELLTTTHAYPACRKVLDYVAERTGSRVVAVELPFPVRHPEEIVAAVLAGVSARTRIALLDHVTSPTALVLPVERLVAELRARGVESLVDGSHAPGMVPLELSALGAAYYAGNAHKWLCAPKGAAFLHVRSDRQSKLHPSVISHGHLAGFHAEFDWPGTFDPTPWLCVPVAIEYLGRLLDGGWSELMARNHALALQARTLLCERFAIAPPCPAEMIGAMVALPTPPATASSPALMLNRDELATWFRDRGVETWFAARPFRMLRVSTQLYNTIDQVATLANLLVEALRGPSDVRGID